MQKIIQLSQLKEYLKGKRILWVHGNAAKKMDIESYLSGLKYTEFTDFKPNPDFESLKKGVKVFEDNNCDCVLATGGGSAIDIAKCIKLWGKEEDLENLLLCDKKDNNILLVALPTTAGSGSEATKHAVIYYKGVKQSISDESIIPKYVIFEPDFLKNLPLYQKKATLLDALCHAVESAWSLKSTKESEEYSSQALKLIKKYWRVYIEGCTDDEVLENIQLAAYKAGQAINITATTAAHAMSYKMTSLYGISHGHAAGIALREVWEFLKNNMDACIDPRGSLDLTRRVSLIESFINLKEYKDILEKMNIERPAAHNFSAEISELVSSVNENRLSNFPVKISSQDLKRMYERIVEK